MPKLLILGAGGFGRCVGELAQALGSFDGIAWLDDRSTARGVLGPCGSYAGLLGEYDCAYAAFGDNRLRMEWLEKLHEAGFETPALVHPRAYVSPSAVLEKGVAVLPGAVVHTAVLLHEGVLVNCNAVVDHDTVVGRGTHIGLGVIVKANCTLPPMQKYDAGTILRSGSGPEIRAL